MANYLCRATNPRVPDYLVKKVSVPADTTLHAGDIVMLKALDSGIDNNYQVYTGSKPATADYKEFISSETRYSRLTRAFPERAEQLFEDAAKSAEQRYEHLARLVDLYK